MIGSFEFEGHELTRVFKGNWQLAGGHGAIDPKDAMDTLNAYAEHGINAFDVGDIYNNSELILGSFLQQTDKPDIRVHTKFVPDLDALADLTQKDIRSIIERSLGRLGIESLHLVQFHWWDFERGDYLGAAKYLQQLKDEGLIEALGVTNCDREHIKVLLENGVDVASNQLQFSLIDPRPLNGMLEFAKKNDISIFCYGTLAGGLLANARPGDEPENRSHIKYSLMLENTSASYYKQVVQTLHDLAEKYHTTAANIAAGFILQTDGVSSIILGPRNTKHIPELEQLEALQLSDADYNQLMDLLRSLQASTPDDVYSYERDRDSPHGRIMKYNLNGMRS